MTSLEPDYREMLSRIAEGVVLVDADGIIQYVNDACSRFFDLRDGIVGESIEQIIREKALLELVAGVFATSQTNSCEITVATRRLAVEATVLEKGANVLLVLTDITTQRQLEDVRSDFVANVSHELRTPVSILTGYIENLADFPKMPRAEQLEIFGIMQEHATRLKALLDDLLTLACFDSHSDVLDYADLDLHEFLRRLAQDWQPALASKSMAVVLEVADDASHLWVDRFRFEQVMHNLFDNAFKYTPIEGQIRVRVSVVCAQIEISVEDNGAGIPQEDLPHIFERFYRVDKARSRRYGGTGLGLSIVKHIVLLHGGTVRAESTLQMSTKIIISLPRAASNL